MSKIELKTPEGYFEESFEKTMASTARIRRHRRAAFGIAAAILLTAGIAFTSVRLRYAGEEKAYLAQQAELAELDIFLEIN